jgi:hypothetical protein
MFFRRALACALACALAAALAQNFAPPALAEETTPPGCEADSHRPVDKISHDLGVTEAEFNICFCNVHPARGGHPGGDLQRRNKSVLLPCLQHYNPAITNDGLDEVMNRYRPAARPGSDGPPPRRE